MVGSSKGRAALFWQDWLPTGETVFWGGLHFPLNWTKYVNFFVCVHEQELDATLSNTGKQLPYCLTLHAI